jgi:hypothetical protein
MTSFYRRTSQPGFDPDRPLRLVQDIACKRAIDLRRKRKWQARPVEEHELFDQWAADFRETRLGDAIIHTDPLVWKEFKAILREIVDNLPEMQRVTAYCYVDLYRELRQRDKHRILAAAVSEVLNRNVTLVQVKSAWAAALKTIRRELRRRKYNFIEEDEQ